MRHEILNEKGADELKKYLHNLLSPFDFVINFYKNSKPLDTVDDKKALVTRFIPLLLATTSQLELDDYLYKLAEVTGFSVNAIKNALAAARSHKKVEIEDNNQQEKGYTFKPIREELLHLELTERELLYHMLSHEDAILFYEQNIEYFYTDLYRDIANYLTEYRLRHATFEYQLLINDIEEIVNKKISK